MFLLKTQDPESATGFVAEVYKAFAEVGVPEPLKLLSASPGMVEVWFNSIKYFRDHQSLSPQLLASIRYVVSKKCGHVACQEFNGKLLCKMGAKEEELAELANRERTELLEAHEQALLDFVFKAVTDARSVSAEDVKALNDLGVSDSDILDATMHGANMKAATDVYLAFAKD
jgi:alkylhydroperoxidase family enzyme